MQASGLSLAVFWVVSILCVNFFKNLLRLSSQYRSCRAYVRLGVGTQGRTAAIIA